MPEIKVLSERDLVPEVAIAVGTRPGIVIMAPIIHECRRRGLAHFVIHTGQHYSPNMDAQFFEDLDLPAPEYRLEGVSEKPTHGGQTAVMLEGTESVLLARRPRLMLVCGDANTNLAAALAARKLHVAVGHVEAGERSGDWRMPEEHNRVMIDHISDHLFATSERSVANLTRESVRGRIHLVGNPIVDASHRHLDLATRRSQALRHFAAEPGKYALLTTHREENVDARNHLSGILSGVSAAAQALQMPVLFFAHPRTQKRLREFGLDDWAASLPRLSIAEAVGYLDFLALLANAALVFTDSGGVQQEACIHHVPCVTLRENTEWSETLEIGANRLAGSNPELIVSAARRAIECPTSWPVPFGDGNSAGRIVDIAEDYIRENRTADAASYLPENPQSAARSP